MGSLTTVMLTHTILPMENLAIIHNGIIENYATLKQELINKGHNFLSDTDTEVFIHFIEDIQENEELRIGRSGKARVDKSGWGLCHCSSFMEEPDLLVAATKR